LGRTRLQHCSEALGHMMPGHMTLTLTLTLAEQGAAPSYITHRAVLLAAPRSLGSLTTS